MTALELIMSTSQSVVAIAKKLTKPKKYWNRIFWPALTPIAGLALQQMPSDKLYARSFPVKMSATLLLTGGRAAGRLYNYWSHTSTLPLKRIHFMFGDERCVPSDHTDSNYALVMENAAR